MNKIFQKKERNPKIFCWFLFIFAIGFAFPSVKYWLQERTVLHFTEEFKFLLVEGDGLYQTLFFAFLLLGFVISYGVLIKNRSRIFKREKQIFGFILGTSAIFVLVVPFMSSDVFYYLGIGRLNSQYGQNPYYVTMKDYVEQGNVDLEQDTVMQKGYNNYWSGTTVVYGPVWTMICSVISAMSFGNVDVGLFLFKVMNLLVHLLSCWVIYKMTKKSVFVLLYGLNPFVLIEGIGNVHNDMFVVLFLLLAFYMVLKKKNLVLSVFFLALATDIKYFAILVLPLVVIYFYRNEKIARRIVKCIEYGGLYSVFVIIPYVLYFQDFQVFMGLRTQREQIVKGFYFFVMQYFTNPEGLHELLAETIFYLFVVMYFCYSVCLLCQKKIVWRKEVKELYGFILGFLFLLITNFQPWYFMWLTPFLFWQNSRNIKLIVQMQILTLVANMVFLVYSEYYVYGVPYFVVLIVGILVCMVKNKKEKVVYVRG